MKYGIIGRVAEGTNMCDGQTIKTRVLAEEIKRMDSEAIIIIADTYNYKKRPFNLFCKIFEVLRESEVVFILLSRNGMRVIFPIVNGLNLLFDKPILHDCIGGSLDNIVQQYPKLIRQLNRFNVNWVESQKLKSRLEGLGVKNVEYLPNFKRLNIIETPVTNQDPDNIMFCTFSRVCEEKGITNAVNTVIELNSELNNKKIFLDIYGPIEKDYKEKLNGLLLKAEGMVRYKGIANPQKSVDILKNYYMLLFPTKHRGEGFPGTFIDAFSSALPIIASDWNLNGEIVKHNETGFIYSSSSPEKLKYWMIYAIENSMKIMEMRYNCIEEAKKYHPDIVMRQIECKIRQLISKENEKV